MRRPFVAGNWKMNTTRAEAVELASGVARGAEPFGNVDVLVAPPFPYLLPVRDAVGGSSVLVGAQNCHHEPSGAFTGEVAVPMLVDAGCSHTILGHSERRHGMGEDDERISRKVHAALEGGLSVILCIGELLDEREAERTESVLEEQLTGSLKGVDAAAMEQVTIAYEPVWAIGTGKVATPDQAQAAHAFVRKWLSGQYNTDVGEGTRIQYGGSVKPDNAAELLSQPDVDGALVGGASLKAESFLGIVSAANG